MGHQYEYHQCLGRVICLRALPQPAVAFGSPDEIVKYLADLSQADRWEALEGTKASDQIRRFQNGDIDILFVPKNMGTGFSLTAAKTVVFLSHAGGPAARQQMISRARRVGTPHEVKIAEYAIGYGMSERLLKVVLRRERWAQRWKTIRKWLFGFAIATYTLL